MATVEDCPEKLPHGSHSWGDRQVCPGISGIKGEIRTVASSGGEKGMKPERYDLIPEYPLRVLAQLYGKGAEKYAERNWERGFEWSKSFAAMMRHAWQFWRGEEVDEETGLSHLASVAWHAFALLEWTQKHTEFDDRPIDERSDWS